MTTRHSIRLLAAAALLLAVPTASRADDLLDNVLRDDYPATPPVTLQPLSRPPASVQPSEPATAPQSDFDEAGDADQSASKRTFESQLMDAFAGCCFFVRPVPPKKRSADDEDTPMAEDFP